MCLQLSHINKGGGEGVSAPVEGVEGRLHLLPAQAQLAAQSLNDTSAACINIMIEHFVSHTTRPA